MKATVPEGSVTGSSVTGSSITGELQQAAVLISGIHNFTSLAQQLSADEVTELLSCYRAMTSQPMLENDCINLQFTGDGLIAVFADGVDRASRPCASRAISAALALALAAHIFRGWLAERFPACGLAPVAMGVGLHCGDVTLCRLGTVQQGDIMPMGETVTLAARLQTATQTLGWTIAASSTLLAQVLAQSGDDIRTGSHTALAVRGDAPAVDVLEVTGYLPSTQRQHPGLTGCDVSVSTAVKLNSEIVARAAKITRDARASLRQVQGFEGADAAVYAAVHVAVCVAGYRIIKKIGSGGMTEVYLAQRQSDGLHIALKVLDTRTKNAAQQLAHLMREYALLSMITHPHIIRIYGQGLADGHAYLAMEYFERGDMRPMLGLKMPHAQVLAIISDVASALDALHTQGIVHCDIKPGNIMQRSDASVALADFGIARFMAPAENGGLLQAPHDETLHDETPHDDVLGTPYYLSPEQVRGQTITPQSDLYSLGVVMFELLAGQRPFMAESLNTLLAQHLHAPTPLLPPESAHLQSMVDKLMQKDLALRYASAQELLTDLQQL